MLYESKKPDDARGKKNLILKKRRDFEKYCFQEYKRIMCGYLWPVSSW